MSRNGVRKPITNTRSNWVRGRRQPITPEVVGEWHVRRVHDGELRALVADEGDHGLHMSISHAPAGRRQKGRYPSWDEIADARDVLLPPDVAFVMHLPVADEYVAMQDTTFHLHQHPTPVAEGAPSPAEVRRLAEWAVTNGWYGLSDLALIADTLEREQDPRGL